MEEKWVPLLVHSGRFKGTSLGGFSVAYLCAGPCCGFQLANVLSRYMPSSLEAIARTAARRFGGKLSWYESFLCSEQAG